MDTGYLHIKTKKGSIEAISETDICVGTKP